MQRRAVLLAFVLSLPILAFIAHHYICHSRNLTPTGITMDENVLYVSYARQYLDSDKFSFFYSNPFDGDPKSPKLYFQPHTLLLSGLIAVGVNSGLAITLFGYLAAIACILMGIKIIYKLQPESKNLKLISLLFTWGGGLTAVTGLGAFLVLNISPEIDWFDSIYIADPARGWWGLNWGRNLFIPLEAWYHFLFLLNIYLILSHKWKLSLLFSIILSISHPFTGIEYLLIINGWMLIEKVIHKNKNIPLYFLIGILLLTGFHLWYYIIYLNQFPEHKQIYDQYKLGWTYGLSVAIPAYVLVLILAINSTKIKFSLKRPSQQTLFLAWIIIAFLLSKHEWFIEPIQPLHFTRGYVWAGLFFFALPTISWLLSNSMQKSKKWLLILAVSVFLSDNVFWTVNLLNEKYNTEWEGHISKETMEVLNFLEKTGDSNDLVVGNATLANYLVHAFTPANSWISHPYNTPRREKRITLLNQFISSGNKPKEWEGRRVIFLVDKKQGEFLSERGVSLFQNKRYLLFIP